MARPLRRRIARALEPTSAAFSKPVPGLPIPSARSPPPSCRFSSPQLIVFFFLFFSFDLILSFDHIVSLALCLRVASALAALAYTPPTCLLLLHPRPLTFLTYMHFSLLPVLCVRSYADLDLLQVP